MKIPEVEITMALVSIFSALGEFEISTSLIVLENLGCLQYFDIIVGTLLSSTGDELAL